jgi:hypothetical protein
MLNYYTDGNHLWSCTESYVSGKCVRAWLDQGFSIRRHKADIRQHLMSRWQVSVAGSTTLYLMLLAVKSCVLHIVPQAIWTRRRWVSGENIYLNIRMDLGPVHSTFFFLE